MNSSSKRIAVLQPLFMLRHGYGLWALTLHANDTVQLRHIGRDSALGKPSHNSY